MASTLFAELQCAQGPLKKRQWFVEMGKDVSGQRRVKRGLLLKGNVEEEQRYHI